MYAPGNNWWRPTATANELEVTRPLRQRSFNRALSATPRVLTYSTRDVIDNRISIPAQHSLVRLSKNPATSADAVAILKEIKAGRLGGVFCVNWKTPAQRALRIGQSWWTVIPKSEDAVLMLDPDNPLRGQPLIAFRRELDPNCGLLQGEKRFAASPARLDAALLKAWASYRLMQLIGGRPGSVAKCSLATSQTRVSASHVHGRMFTNVVPTLRCEFHPQISKQKLCKGICSVLGRLVTEACRIENNCPTVPPGDLPDDCNEDCALKGLEAEEKCRKVLKCPDDSQAEFDSIYEMEYLNETELPRATLPPLGAPRVLTYTTNDVIDNRISIPAQHSLVRLSKNPATSADAVGMLQEVKAGRLAGIFCVNWKTSAQRALRLGHSWWTVIPKSEDAVLMLDPDNLLRGQPLIAFRRELDPDCGLLQGEKRFAASPARLDAALLKAWASYKLLQSSGELNKCVVAPAGGIVAEIGQPRSATPLTNVMPLVSCQGGAAPSCFQTVRDSTFSLLLGTPVRDLTKEQARDIVVMLIGANLLTLDKAPKFDKDCKVLFPPPDEKVTIRPTIIDGVAFVSDDKNAKRTDPLPAIDLRLAVLLFTLARFLRLTWGVTEIHHIGIGSAGTHAGRLAVDLSGVVGDVPSQIKKFGISLSGPFTLNVLKHWGDQDVEFPTGTCRKGWPRKIKDAKGRDVDFRDTTYRLDENQNQCTRLKDRDSILAFLIFRDIYSFATFHCTDKRTPGSPTCKGRHSQQGPPTTIGKQSQCIIHPDHPDPGNQGRARHQNHFHMEIPL